MCTNCAKPCLPKGGNIPCDKQQMFVQQVLEKM